MVHASRQCAPAPDRQTPTQHLVHRRCDRPIRTDSRSRMAVAAARGHWSEPLLQRFAAVRQRRESPSNSHGSRAQRTGRAAPESAAAPARADARSRLVGIRNRHRATECRRGRLSGVDPPAQGLRRRSSDRHENPPRTRCAAPRRYPGSPARSRHSARRRRPEMRPDERLRAQASQWESAGVERRPTKASTLNSCESRPLTHVSGSVTFVDTTSRR
jgi:hypothetical protein